MREREKTRTPWFEAKVIGWIVVPSELRYFYIGNTKFEMPFSYPSGHVKTGIHV